MDNAIAEAKARGDEFNLLQFNASQNKPQQADEDSAEMYLFDSRKKRHLCVKVAVEQPANIHKKNLNQ